MRAENAAGDAGFGFGGRVGGVAERCEVMEGREGGRVGEKLHGKGEDGASVIQANRRYRAETMPMIW